MIKKGIIAVLVHLEGHSSIFHKPPEGLCNFQDHNVLFGELVEMPRRPKGHEDLLIIELALKALARLVTVHRLDRRSRIIGADGRHCLVVVRVEFACSRDTKETCCQCAKNMHEKREPDRDAMRRIAC